MLVKLLTEHHLEFLSLKGGCRGSSESTHVKMPQCWKSHVMAQMSKLCLVAEIVQETLMLEFYKAICIVLYIIVL